MIGDRSTRIPRLDRAVITARDARETDIGDIGAMANARALKYLKISVPVDVTARARDFTARARAILDGNVFVDDSEALDGRAREEGARERGEIDRIHGGWEFLVNSQPTRSST